MQSHELRPRNAWERILTHAVFIMLCFFREEKQSTKASRTTILVFGYELRLCLLCHSFFRPMFETKQRNVLLVFWLGAFLCVSSLFSFFSFVLCLCCATLTYALTQPQAQWIRWVLASTEFCFVCAYSYKRQRTKCKQTTDCNIIRYINDVTFMGALRWKCEILINTNVL